MVESLEAEVDGDGQDGKPGSVQEPGQSQLGELARGAPLAGSFSFAFLLFVRLLLVVRTAAPETDRLILPLATQRPDDPLVIEIVEDGQEEEGSEHPEELLGRSMKDVLALRVPRSPQAGESAGRP